MSFPRYVFHVEKKKAYKINANGTFKVGSDSALLVELSKNSSTNIQFVDGSYHLQRIQIELLINCNLKCLHCYSESGPGKDKGLAFTNVCKIIDEAHEMGVLAIDLTGGEPLLRKDILEIISYIRNKGMLVSMFTNGTMLTAAKAQAIADAGVQFAQVSIDGLTPETHDVFRQKKGALKKAFRAIEFLRDQGIIVKANVIVNKKNLQEIKPLVDFIQNDLKIGLGLDRLMPAGRANVDNEWALSPTEFYQYVRTQLDEGVNVNKVCDSPISMNSIEPHCGVGAFYMYIKYNGQGVVCPTMTPSESMEFESHDICALGLKEVWQNGSAFKKYRGLQCKNIRICPAANICRGGCRSNAYFMHGHADSPDELNCNLFKNKTKTYIEFIKEYDLGIYRKIV